MQRLRILTFMLLVTVTGCVAPKSPPPVQLLTNELSPEDMDFAVALARYSAGIAEEIKAGPASGRSVDFFLEASQSDPSNYALARKAAIGLLYRRRTIEAGEVLEAASSLNPTNYPILLDLATIYDIGDQPEKRIATYERALALSPVKSSAYIASARGYLKEGQLDKALKMLERGAENADAQIMSDLALVNAAALLKGGFPERSIDWFKFTAKISEVNRGKLNVIIAEIYEGQNERAKAIKHYEYAVRAKNAEPEAFVKMAIMLGDTRLDASMQILDRAEARFPMNDLILTAIVYLAEREDSIPTALEILERIEERTKTEPSNSFYLHLGAAYEQNGDIKSAAKTFQNGLRNYPDSHELLNYLAYMWAEKGLNLKQAEALSKNSLRLEPESGPYIDTLGWIYFMQGNNGPAREYIEKALEKLPKDPTVLDHLGDILAKDGDIDEAISNWRKSYEIDPSNQTLKDKLLKHEAVKQNTDKK